MFAVRRTVLAVKHVFVGWCRRGGVAVTSSAGVSLATPAPTSGKGPPRGTQSWSTVADWSTGVRPGQQQGSGLYQRQWHQHGFTGPLPSNTLELGGSSGRHAWRSAVPARMTAVAGRLLDQHDCAKGFGPRPRRTHADAVGSSTAGLDNTGTIATAGSISSALAYFEILPTSPAAPSPSAPFDQAGRGHPDQQSGDLHRLPAAPPPSRTGSTFTDPAGTLTLRIDERGRGTFTQKSGGPPNWNWKYRRWGHSGRLGRPGRTRRHRQQHPGNRHQTLPPVRPGHAGDRIVGHRGRVLAERRDRRRTLAQTSTGYAEIITGTRVLTVTGVVALVDFDANGSQGASS